MPDTVLPLLSIVQPESPDELRDVVRDHAAHGTPLCPLGGRQSLRYGAAMTRDGVGVCTTGMRRCIDYPADDLTVTVEAGMTFAELSAILAEKNQRLAWDVFDPEQATVGGILATAWSGPRRWRWGDVRDSVVGITVVDGTGRSFRSGGRVVKNAAGYELGRLFCGTLGTFGIITEVTLAVRPLPETHAWVLCRHPFPDRSEELFRELTANRMIPSAALVAVGGDFDSMGIPENEDGNEREPRENEALFAVEYEGEASEVGWMLDETLNLFSRIGLSPQEVLDADSEPLLHGFAAAAVGGTGKTGLSICGMPGDAAEMLWKLRDPQRKSVSSDSPEYGLAENAMNAGICDTLVADLGTGVLRGRTDLRPERVARWVRDLRRDSAQEKYAMKVTVVDAPIDSTTPEIWDIPTVWGDRGPNFPLFETLKKTFDPEGILNPGRYIFHGRM
ncbi:MAG: FAD-binding oxidoreductase [Planctomycetia bacterium]|nr:FAD-binding oxidoreductase [Planctomycetia bacterium]